MFRRKPPMPQPLSRESVARMTDEELAWALASMTELLEAAPRGLGPKECQWTVDSLALFVDEYKFREQRPA